jgi:LCP family protein required for cell wall assembly
MTDDRRDTSPDDQGPDGPESSEESSGGKRKSAKRFGRRHPLVIGLVVLLAVLLTGAGGYAWYLNHTLGSVPHADFIGDLPEEKRPEATETGALNILMAGVDKGTGGSVGDFIDKGWEPGVFRSDTIMILHVTADRDHAYLVSIPRDAYVRIYNGSGEVVSKNKINVALSTHGPAAYVSTIEHLTGLRMDHQAIVDWSGFKDIADALGGVEVYIPETFYDTSQKIQWVEGRQLLKGDEALAYVRTRYNLPDQSGDFGRIARQQNFLRSMMGKMLSKGTIANPVRLTNTLKAVVKYITVDNEFSTGEIRDLILSMRGIKTEDVTFVTAPWTGYGNEAGSTVHLDMSQCQALWTAMREDDMAGYIDKFGPDSGVLEGPKGVN